MTAIGLHAPVGGSLRYEEPPANEHREREYEICPVPGCGRRKAKRSRTCRPCSNYARQHARWLCRKFEIWLERRKRT